MLRFDTVSLRDDSAKQMTKSDDADSTHRWSRRRNASRQLFERTRCQHEAVGGGLGLEQAPRETAVGAQAVRRALASDELADLLRIERRVVAKVKGDALGARLAAEHVQASELDLETHQLHETP